MGLKIKTAMKYSYKEQRHPQRRNEYRLLVTWPGYGWYHKLGDITVYRDDKAEAWPAYRLHKDVSRLFDSYDAAVDWLIKLWERRQRGIRNL